MPCAIISKNLYQTTVICVELLQPPEYFRFKLKSIDQSFSQSEFSTLGCNLLEDYCTKLVEYWFIAWLLSCLCYPDSRRNDRWWTWNASGAQAIIPLAMRFNFVAIEVFIDISRKTSQTPSFPFWFFHYRIMNGYIRENKWNTSCSTIYDKLWFFFTIESWTHISGKTSETPAILPCTIRYDLGNSTGLLEWPTLRWNENGGPALILSSARFYFFYSLKYQK